MKHVLFTIVALGFVTQSALAAERYGVNRMAQATALVDQGSGDQSTAVERAKAAAAQELQSEIFLTAEAACRDGRVVTYYAAQPSCVSTGSAAYCETNVTATCTR